MQQNIPYNKSIQTCLSLCFKLLLYAYPAHFRQQYGIGMAQVFRDETRFLLRQKNTLGLIQFLIRSLFDLAKTMLIEHLNDFFNIKLAGENMSYQDSVDALSDNPEKLEQLYHDAIKAGRQKAFQQAIDDNYKNTPNNLLLAGWFHRLHYAARQAKQLIIEWRWLIPLAIFNGLLFWWFADDERYMTQLVGGANLPQNFLPLIFFWWTSLTAIFILIYFTLAGKKKWRLMVVAAFVPLIASAYVNLVYKRAGVRPFQEQYLSLMLIHLPLLAWASVGAFFLAQQPDAHNRLLFLLKSVEAIVVGGIFTGALYAFSGITIGLFNALDVEFSEVLLRLIFGGGLGIILVIAPAIIYEPTVPPDEQTFSREFFRLISALMQALLPLTFLVLAIYIGFIPANFRAPFDNRDILIVYNIMLFAVVGLLVGATILRPADSSTQRDRWLRRLIIGVALLTLIVSLYALSAIIYRTINDRLTPNRLAIVGWNIINIGLLALLLILQWRAKEGQWLDRLYRTFSMGTNVYAIWTVIVILALPWLFRLDLANMANLPVRIQNVLYEQPSPVLFKCYGSPHIYLLDGEEKRWIQDIETFTDQGYVWDDVNFVPCVDLRNVPDGTPIPADAGIIPEP